LAAARHEDGGEELPSRQYALHVAGERIAGLEPPPGAAGAHGELQAALAEARDATAEVAGAFAHGGAQAAHPLVWEWRGTLFAVRLARQRLMQAPERAPAERVPAGPRRRSEAVVLAVFALPARADRLSRCRREAPKRLVSAEHLQALEETRRNRRPRDRDPDRLERLPRRQPQPFGDPSQRRLDRLSLPRLDAVERLPRGADD